MTDGPDNPRKGQRNDAERSVESLASEALKSLARSRGAKSKRVAAEFVTLLRNAVISQEYDDRHEVIAAMRTNDISTEEIIDIYIPEVARVLGEEWCVDQSSFADVTIGAARLQGLLRDLIEESNGDRARPSTAPGVAVAVVADEYHTLGALVLTAQLRRIGVSVKLVLDADSTKLPESIVRDDRFDAVLISASRVDSLIQLAKFVERLRRQLERKVPIVIGGPVLSSGIDVRAATGADFATSDLIEALRLCQLKISRHAADSTAGAS